MPTELQRRILEDFADGDPRTRHTRALFNESRDELPKLIKLGWLAHGDPKKGKWHYITEAGLAVLAERTP